MFLFPPTHRTRDCPIRVMHPTQALARPTPRREAFPTTAEGATATAEGAGAERRVAATHRYPTTPVAFAGALAAWRACAIANARSHSHSDRRDRFLHLFSKGTRSCSGRAAHVPLPCSYGFPPSFPRRCYVPEPTPSRATGSAKLSIRRQSRPRSIDWMATLSGAKDATQATILPLGRAKGKKRSRQYHLTLRATVETIDSSYRDERRNVAMASRYRSSHGDVRIADAGPFCATSRAGTATRASLSHSRRREQVSVESRCRLMGMPT